MGTCRGRWRPGARNTTGRPRALADHPQQDQTHEQPVSPPQAAGAGHPRRNRRARHRRGPRPARCQHPEGREYAALRVLLHDNLRALADIQSHEARVPRKAEFARAFDRLDRGRAGRWRTGPRGAGRHPRHHDALGHRLPRFSLGPASGRPCHPLPSGHARLHPLGRLYRRRGNRRDRAGAGRGRRSRYPRPDAGPRHRGRHA
jgi:hypothetical protein